MTRTNIEIDDELITTVMKQNRLKTKKDAVDFALRKVARATPSVDEILALRGIGFPYSNDELESFDGVREW